MLFNCSWSYYIGHRSKGGHLPGKVATSAVRFEPADGSGAAVTRRRREPVAVSKKCIIISFSRRSCTTSHNASCNALVRRRYMRYMRWTAFLILTLWVIYITYTIRTLMLHCLLKSSPWNVIIILCKLTVRV